MRALIMIKYQNWMSMESAPRDGTKVLLFIPRVRSIIIGFFIDKSEYLYGKEVFRTRHWCTYGKFTGIENLNSPYEPSQWMPLPELPNSVPEQELCDKQNDGVV
jgi:hypothetical protein